MRLISIAISVLFFVVRCAAPVTALCIFSTSILAQQSQEGFVQVGTFTTELNGDLIEFTSFASDADDYSDLNVTDQFGIKTYHFSGSVGGGLPILEATLQEGGVVGDLDIVSITVIDRDYDTALAASHTEVAGTFLDSYGAISNEVLAIGADGVVVFVFDADLVRIVLDDESPIPNEPGAHITGRFSGTIPTSEMDRS